MVQRYVRGVPREQDTGPQEWALAFGLALSISGMYVTCGRPALYAIMFCVYSALYLPGQLLSNTQMARLMIHGETIDSELSKRVSHGGNHELKEAFERYLTARGKVRDVLRRYYGKRLVNRIYAHLAAGIVAVLLTGAAWATSFDPFETAAALLMAGTLVGGQALVWFWTHQRGAALAAADGGAFEYYRWLRQFSNPTDR